MSARRRPGSRAAGRRGTRRRGSRARPPAGFLAILLLAGMAVGLLLEAGLRPEAPRLIREQEPRGRLLLPGTPGRA